MARPSDDDQTASRCVVAVVVNAIVSSFEFPLGHRSVWLDMAGISGLRAGGTWRPGIVDIRRA